MRTLVFSFLVCCCGALTAQPKSLFYLTDSPESIRSFFAHSSKIDILVPTWYSVDGNGLITGSPEPAVLKEAHQSVLSVMPIIALFGKSKFHQLALSNEAQDRMNEAMLR